jgi:hypothetical protein
MYIVKIGGPFRVGAPAKWKKMGVYPGSPYQTKALAVKTARRLSREALKGTIVQVCKGYGDKAPCLLQLESSGKKRKKRK